MDGGFGEVAPSHPTEPIAAFPGAEDLLDPAPGPMNGIVPCLQPGKCFLFVAAPHRRFGNTERAAFRPDCVAEMIAPIGAVGKNLARIIGHGGHAASPFVAEYSGANFPAIGSQSIRAENSSRVEAPRSIRENSRQS